jgi:hypothetical protein
MKVQYRRRNRVRYPGYDYAQAGAVSVTVCSSGRQALFGVVIDHAVSLSPAGELVHDTWQRIPKRFPGVFLDAWIVMPDHLHGILQMGADPDMLFSPDTTGNILRWFTSSTVAGYREPRHVRPSVVGHSGALYFSQNVVYPEVVTGPTISSLVLKGGAACCVHSRLLSFSCSSSVPCSLRPRLLPPEGVSP